ncbi:MAG: hypothetical protein ABJ004_16360 [Cyclobacteriaceae bacterium]
MSIAFKSSKDFDSNQIVSFNLDPQYLDKEAKSIYDSLELFQKLSFGELYKQKESINYWYVDTDQNFAYIIAPDRVEAILTWDKENLLPNDLIFEKLAQIGGTPPHQWTMYQDYIDFPCQVKSEEGIWTDFCKIRFTKTAPFQTHYKKLKLLNEIVDVKESEFTMPHNLRISNTLTEDIRMSFFPFMVKTKKGNYLTYNGDADFVSKGNLKAEEISHEVEFSYDRFKKVAETPSEDVTYIIGKWDSRLEELLKTYKEERKKLPPTRAIPNKGFIAKLKDLFS